MRARLTFGQLAWRRYAQFRAPAWHLMRAADLLRHIRLIAWIVLALAPVVVGAVLILTRQHSRGLGPLPSSGFVVAQPFRLTTHTGQPFTERDFKAKPHLVFFGFTNCPDISPTTLPRGSACNL